MNNFKEFGIEIPKVLLPKDKDLKTWCCVACDQYTQDSEYWEKAKECTQGKPSALNLILPEVYLNSPDKEERIKKIHKDMASYIENGVFDDEAQEFIYIERKTEFGRIRKGLLCAIDLDCYEWKPFSKALIRATEATITDRIPPRKAIRKGAPLESPHIMLLVNDKSGLLVENAGVKAKKGASIYSGPLMMQSGSITGWAIRRKEELESIYKSLSVLKTQNTDKDGTTFMFAVGDGNHSLATAKAVWDEYKEELKKQGKSEQEILESPVRYALAEIVNIYDEGLTFEPIHRALFNADFNKLVSFLKEKMSSSCKEPAALSSREETERAVQSSKGNFALVRTVNSKEEYTLFKTDVSDLLVSRLQPALDAFLKENPASKIDYIHGSGEVFRLAQKEGTITILLPPVAKDSFFTSINSSGPLPRKSFSMGEASEKRFYLECRRLF